MSTARRTASDTPTASDVAATIRDAPFVHVLAAANGDALATAGVLAQACESVGVPFQVSVTPTNGVVTTRLDACVEDTIPVVVGAQMPTTDGVGLESRSVSLSAVAYEAAEELDASPDPILALAGAIAGEYVPGTGGTDRILDHALDEEVIERRPGVAVPTDDLADGLAHTTLVHAVFSGNPGAVQAELAELSLPMELDEGAHRTVASMVALTTAGDSEATSRAGDAVQRAVHPYATPEGPFATLGGYADVLDVTARELPGAGIALALGHGGREEALDAWREQTGAAHTALRQATTGRYDGVFVARIDEGPVTTTAKLLADFRSPEPVALVVTDDEAGAATTKNEDAGDVRAAFAGAVESVGGDFGGSPSWAYAQYDGDETAFINAVREEL